MKKHWTLGSLAIAILAIALVMVGLQDAQADAMAAKWVNAPAATLVVRSKSF